MMIVMIENENNSFDRVEPCQGDSRFRFRRWVFLIFFLIFLFLILLKPFFLNLKSAAAAENPQSYQITVSATIGESRLTLFGWTSPQSLVELQGQRVSESVIANNQGYFFFDRILLPAPRSPRSASGVGEVEPTYPELCLTSIDTQSRASFPTCLPPLPLGSFDISIGPVLLPPTISLSKGNFLPNEQAIAQGLTIPDSEVTIFLANDISKKSLISQFLNILISPVNAYSLPKYQVRADEKGNFEFNLPSNSTGPTSWKIFAAATHLGSPSPKSNTLTFRILGWWEWLWEQIKLILGLIVGLAKPYWWQIIIFLEIGILLVVKRKMQSEKRKTTA